MASNAFAGVGALFQRSSMAGTPVFSTIAEVNSISLPNMSRGTHDVTSLDSTGGYKEFIGGFRDSGEVKIDLNFTEIGYNDLMEDFQTDSLIDYQIILPDTGATTLGFSAVCTAVGGTIPTDGKVTASATFKISGPVTLTT